jgi:putative addiction module antidote
MSKKPPQPPTKTPAGVSERPAPFEAAAKPAGRTLKVRRVGNSLGVVLPKEVLAKLRVGEGDMLSVSETPDGVTLTLCDDEVQRQIEIGRDLMKRYRNALRELAK